MALSLEPDLNPESSALLGSNPPRGDELKEYAWVAERMLGLDGLKLSGSKRNTALTAVAVQIRFMNDHGMNPRKYVSEGRADRSFQASKAAQRGVDPMAQRLADDVRSGTDAADTDYDVLKSMR